MKKNNNSHIKKILEHPDFQEIISKLLLDHPVNEIHDWLKEKYSSVKEAKLVISEKNLKEFKDKYLDIYSHIKEDLLKTKQISASDLVIGSEVSLAIKNNKEYKNKILELAGQEVDLKKMITNMLVAIETRAGQVFDSIQENPDSIKADRVLIEWFDTLGNMLEKYNKLVNQAPDQIIQHNITYQVVDQHISVFQEVIRDVLSQMDLETSLYFMEVFNEKMAKLKPGDMQQEKPLPIEQRLAEAKILNETINERLEK